MRSEEEKHRTRVTLPTIPQEHSVRFRNKFLRVRAYLCWIEELEEISRDIDDPLQMQAKKFVATEQERQFATAFYKIVSQNMIYVKHFETQTKSQVRLLNLKTTLFKNKHSLTCHLKAVDVMQLYMRALEWAVNYRKETINKYEYALRCSFTDAICEQIFGGKFVKAENGETNPDAKKREWCDTDVPLRLTDIHLFASFLIPDNNDFKFQSTLDALYNAGQLNNRHEKNKLKIISK